MVNDERTAANAGAVPEVGSTIATKSETTNSFFFSLTSVQKVCSQWLFMACRKRKAQEVVVQDKGVCERSSESSAMEAAALPTDAVARDTGKENKKGDVHTVIQHSGGDDEPAFAIDDCVMLHGLKGASQFNGRIGKIICYDTCSERYGVELHSSKEKKSVKVANLQRVAASCQAQGREIASTLKKGVVEQRARSDVADAALWEAVLASDLDKLKDLLKQGADPNVRNKMGETPLFDAVAKGRGGLVSELISARADPLVESHKFKSVHMLTNDTELRLLLGVPGLEPISESEWLKFCKLAVPGWRDLPKGVTLRSRGFAEGASSNIQMVDLIGAGREQVSPSACVYGFSGAFTRGYLLPHLSKPDVARQRIRNQIAVVAAGAGVAPGVFASVGRHRVMEYFPGQPLARRGQGNFLSTLYAKMNGFFGAYSGLDHGSDPNEMARLGKVIGLIHALPLDWLEDVAGTAELAEHTDVLQALFPQDLAQFTGRGRFNDLVERAINLKVFPHTGFFAQPVVCHGDLHRGNMLKAEDGTLCFVDWELSFVGNRGYDLGYFLLNCSGATAESLQAFAWAYLAACSLGELTQEFVDDFLKEMARCRIFGLFANLFISAIMSPMSVGIILSMIRRTLDAAEGRPQDDEAEYMAGADPRHSEHLVVEETESESEPPEEDEDTS